jgi:hypothetical protein
MFSWKIDTHTTLVKSHPICFYGTFACCLWHEFLPHVEIDGKIRKNICAEDEFGVPLNNLEIIR